MLLGLAKLITQNAVFYEPETEYIYLDRNNWNAFLQRNEHNSTRAFVRVNRHNCTVSVKAQRVTFCYPPGAVNAWW